VILSLLPVGVLSEINSELGQHDLIGIVYALMVEVLEAEFQISAQPAACLVDQFAGGMREAFLTSFSG
jgi:threonine/homoserine efflux transporter RhtA